MKFYEDLIVGETRQYGAYSVEREEVIDFATKYDPQPFHLDDEAAAQTYFGRVSASGWHTASMMMRMNVDNWADEQQASLGSPGLDELKWLLPVYPGDTLRCETTLIEKRRSASKRHMGLVKSRTDVFNQDGVKVMTMIANGLIKVRDPEVDTE
jgi:acyl dehydratase